MPSSGGKGGLKKGKATTLVEKKVWRDERVFSGEKRVFEVDISNGFGGNRLRSIAQSYPVIYTNSATLVGYPHISLYLNQACHQTTGLM